MSEIKAGDTVRLKSGGPLMTVELVDNYMDKTRKATCTWFDGTKRSQELFVVNSLFQDEEE